MVAAVWACAKIELKSQIPVYGGGLGFSHQRYGGCEYWFLTFSREKMIKAQLACPRQAVSYLSFMWRGPCKIKPQSVRAPWQGHSDPPTLS